MGLDHFQQYCLIACILLLLPLTKVSAQQINITEEPSVSSLMEKYMAWEKKEKQISGWRIQITNTDDRRKMEKDLSDFRQHFPEVRYTNWKQISPYYKVIIGAYDSKLDVLAFLQEVKQYFPSAIPIVEKIDEEELLLNNER